MPTFVPSIRKSHTVSATINTGKIDTRKRKLDQVEGNDDGDNLQAIIDSTQFWHIDLDPNSAHDRRFANIIHGLPKGNPSEEYTSEEQYLKEVEEAIGWIDQWHVERKKKLCRSATQPLMGRNKDL